MFFRTKTVRGTSVLQLVESFRNPEGLPRQRVLASLGDASVPVDERGAIAVYSKGLREGEPYENIRYYISSQTPGSRSRNRWGELIRGHWSGVENRNHWSRDAIWLEDKTRSRNYNLVGNLAMLRNTLLVIVAEHREQYGSLPAFTEALRANESEAYRLITTPL